MSPHRRWAIAAGPITAAIIAGLLASADLPAAACWCGAVTALCGVWWIFEPIAIPATSIIPFAALPLLGVMDHKQVAACYGHPVILLVIGGLMLSTALEKSGAHRRVALGIVRTVGRGSARQVVLGMILAAAVMSMWISNTATTLILLPVATAALEQAEDRRRLALPLVLGVAYGATIGGIGTPVGCATNLMFIAVYRETTSVEVTFTGWMQIGLPVVAVMLPIVWLWLTRRVGAQRLLPTESLGPWRPEERRVLLVFALTALAWTTRAEPFGGWSAWLGATGVGDGTVGLAAVVTMFVLPNGRGGRLLDWQTANKIPWGVLLLLGGGIAIARGFEISGLSAALGDLLAQLGSLPVLLMIPIICLAVTFMTEVTSNTATTALLMPVLAAAGVAASIDPVLLMAPAVISASCAFMLPVATSPNAIAFATGHVSVSQMAREGLVLNLVGIPVVTLVCYLVLSR